MSKDYSKLKKAFANDPQMLRSLEQQENAELLRSIASKEQNALEKIIGPKGEKGDKGEPGEQGEKGDSGEDGMDGIDGADGIDGTDGANGKDGKNGDNGKDGENGKDGKDGKDASPLSIKEIIEEIRASKALDISDIKNWQSVRSNKKMDMNDQRWHGGGLSEVFHDATLTGTGTSTDPLSVVGGGSSILLQTNYNNNGNQNLLNLVGNAGVTITDNGIGDIMFDVIAGYGGLPAVLGIDPNNADISITGHNFLHPNNPSTHILSNSVKGDFWTIDNDPNDNVILNGYDSAINQDYSGATIGFDENGAPQVNGLRSFTYPTPPITFTGNGMVTSFNFTGTGLNDLAVTNPGDASDTFTIIIDGNSIPTIGLGSFAGVITPGDTLTDTTSGATATVLGSSTDSTGVTYVSLSGITGTISIGDSLTAPTWSANAGNDPTSLLVDTFSWQTSSGTGPIQSTPIITNPIILLNDTRIQFGAFSGHTIGDQWDFVVSIGVDDLSITSIPGSFSGTGVVTYDLTITNTGLELFQINTSSIVGPLFVPGDTLNNLTGIGTAVVLGVSYTLNGSITYLMVSLGSGSSWNNGDNFETVGGATTAVLDSRVGTVDSFTWTDSTGGIGSDAPCLPSGVDLSYNVSVAFGSSTGHTIGDEWTFTYAPVYSYSRMGVWDGYAGTVIQGDVDSLTTFSSIDIPNSSISLQANDSITGRSNIEINASNSNYTYLDYATNIRSVLALSTSNATLTSSDLTSGAASGITSTADHIDMSFFDSTLLVGDILINSLGVAISANNANDQLIIDSTQDYMYYRRAGTTYLEVAPAALLGNGTLVRLGNGSQAAWEVRNDPSLVANLADASASLSVIDSTAQPWFQINPASSYWQIGDGIHVNTLTSDASPITNLNFVDYGSGFYVNDPAAIPLFSIQNTGVGINQTFLTGNVMQFALRDSTSYMHVDGPGNYTIQAWLAQTNQTLFNGGVAYYVNVINNNANHTIITSENYIEMHPVTTSTTCFLPAFPVRGDTYFVKNKGVNPTFSNTVNGNGHIIDSNATVVQNSSPTFQIAQQFTYNGTEWSIY